MKKLIYNTLLNWKNSKNKKPMMVIGARQTGKTYIINKFCNNEYKNNVYLNFDNDNKIADIIKENVTENYIVQTLVSKNKDLYYLKMDNNLEIDFF